jgi:hypothetical protein
LLGNVRPIGQSLPAADLVLYELMIDDFTAEHLIEAVHLAPETPEWARRRRP